MAVYRRVKGSDTWHYCKNCSKCQLQITKLARANLFQASSAMNAAAKIAIKTAANKQIPMIE